MNDYGVAEEFGRRLVQRVHQDLLADELRGWRGEHGDFAKQLDAAHFSPEQRRLMWRYAVGLAEAAVYRVVHFLDEEVENERLTLQYTDPALPEDSWEGHLDNPPRVCVRHVRETRRGFREALRRFGAGTSALAGAPSRDITRRL